MFKIFKNMRTKIASLACLILFLSILNAFANEQLSLARKYDRLGWELRLVPKNIRKSNLAFFKALFYYKKYIDNIALEYADIETRGFTPLDAQERVVRIFKFGLKNKILTKREFEKLLKMYEDYKSRFSTDKIIYRLNDRISRIKSESNYSGYVIKIEGDIAFCLFTDQPKKRELIIYQDTIPVARAKIKNIIYFEFFGCLAKAQVFNGNKSIKLHPFYYCESIDPPRELDARLSAKAHQCYRTGADLFENQKFLDAYEYFSEALEYDPNHVQALNKIGMICFGRQDVNGAKKYFRQALEIDPSCKEAFINLAGAYLSDSDFPIDTNIAYDMLEASLSFERNYIRLYYWLGHFFDDFMFFDEASVFYRKAEKMIPVLCVDNWYKQTSLAKKLSSPGQSIWDTANIYLSDREPMLNSGVYALKELLKLNPDDLFAKKRLKEVIKFCPFADDDRLYEPVIAHRIRSFELKRQKKIKDAIDEMRVSLYLDQTITSRFKKQVRKIPIIAID